MAASPSEPVLPDPPPPPPAPPALLARTVPTGGGVAPPPPPAPDPPTAGDPHQATSAGPLPASFPPPPPPSAAPEATPVPPADGEDALFALAELVANTHLHKERWELALRAEQRNDPHACLENCRAVLALAPTDRAATLLAARSARELRDWALASSLLGALLDRGPAEGPAGWEHIVAATVTGDDEAVARTVQRLGLDPATWSDPEAIVLIVMDGRVHVARRCGPARAEILSTAEDGRRQHVGDIVAFEPQPVTVQGPARRWEDGRDLPEWATFRALAVLAPGGRHVWFARGADPGFPFWSDAVEAATAHGWVLRRLQPHHHDAVLREADPLTGPGGGADPTHTDAPFAAAVVPAAAEPTLVEATLAGLSAGWPAPVTWTG